jgi:hypothetical protein
MIKTKYVRLNKLAMAVCSETQITVPRTVCNRCPPGHHPYQAEPIHLSEQYLRPDSKRSIQASWSQSMHTLPGQLDRDFDQNDVSENGTCHTETHIS